MAQCYQCKAETELYDGGIPVCPNCSTRRDEKRQSVELNFMGFLRSRIVSDDLKRSG
jgi:hypothetical protein